MASNFPNTLILAALILVFAATTPLSNANFDTLAFVNTLTVTGQVFCSATGNCDGASPPLAGAPVSLICNTQIFGNTITAVTGTTSGNGGFTLVAIGGPLSSIQFVQYATCRVRVPLPVPGCAAATSGAYVSETISKIKLNLVAQTAAATAAGFTPQA